MTALTLSRWRSVRAATLALPLVSVAMLLSGCWPARFTYQPGITGTVISADDGEPVVGASIKLTVPRQDLLPVSVIETDSEGKFVVEPLYEWGVDSFVGDRLESHGVVEISASGFSPATKAIGFRKPSVLDLGVIELVRR